MKSVAADAVRGPRSATSATTGILQSAVALGAWRLIVLFQSKVPPGWKKIILPATLELLKK